MSGAALPAAARWRRLLLFPLLASALLAAFFAGMHIHQSRVFPFPQVQSAYKTLVVHLGLWRDADFDGLDVRSAQCAPVRESFRHMLSRDYGLPELKCPAAQVARQDAAGARVESGIGVGLADPVVVKGEIGTFLDYCPAPWGCLAVEYSRSGAVTRAWPFRPDEIREANIVSESDYPYQHPAGWSFARDIRWYDISLHPGGDLLVVFHFRNSHPAGGGVARVSVEGRPRWYRKDYSHHWPHVVGDDLVLVPGRRLRRAQLSYPVGRGQRASSVELTCHDGLIKEDQVNVVNGRGDVLEEIPILDAIAVSPHAGALVGADPCNPLHLNFVDVLSERVASQDAGSAADIASGDLVVSLRNLNAFGILDKDDRRMKRLVQGGFHRQHGVRYLDGARFVMFDNLGTDGAQGPSRLLVVDLATGEETTVFPTETTPAHLRDWFAVQRGQFDVSPDRRRILLSDPFGARAFEIRLADGAVLNVFRQIHDLSRLPGFPKELTENPWLFHFHGIHYAHRRQAKQVADGGKPVGSTARRYTRVWPVDAR